MLHIMPQLFSFIQEKSFENIGTCTLHLQVMSIHQYEDHHHQQNDHRHIYDQRHTYDQHHQYDQHHRPIVQPRSQYMLENLQRHISGMDVLRVTVIVSTKELAGTIGTTMAARPAGAKAPQLGPGAMAIGLRLLCPVKPPTATASGTES